MSNPPKQNNWQPLPPEYWIIAGLGLAASHLIYFFLTILGCYTLLRILRSKADSELILLAAVFLGMAIYGGFKTPIANNNLHLFVVIMSFVVAGIALTLLYTRLRIFAWLLFVYSALSIFYTLFVFCMSLLMASRGLAIQGHLSWQYGIFYTALDAFMMWLVWRWLKRSQESLDVASISETAATLEQSKSDKNSPDEEFDEPEKIVDLRDLKFCVACEEAIPENSNLCPKCGWTQPRHF